MIKFAPMKPEGVIYTVVVVFAALLAGCNKKPEPISGRFYTGVLFGKPYEIDAVGDSTDCTRQIDSIIGVFESAFNILDTKSIVSQYNAFSRTDTVFAFIDSSRAFGMVYDLTRDLNMHTMQYFDPTMNPLKRSWIVAKSGGAVEPNLDSLYNFVGFDGAKVDLNEITSDGYEYKESQMRKADERIEVDFTSIAASVALDQIAAFLKARGITQVRIKYGKDVINFGSTVDSLNVIPLGVNSDSSDQMILMRNRAFSSKSAQDKTLMIDPTYGYPADNELVFVAVSAPTLAEAEAFAEAFMIMGLEKAMEYYEKNDQSRIESFMLYSREKQLQSASTVGFDSMILSPDSLAAIINR